MTQYELEELQWVANKWPNFSTSFWIKYCLSDMNVEARAKSALYGIHLIKSIPKYLTLETTQMLIVVLVLSQLDCINSILKMHYSAVPNLTKKSRTKLPELYIKGPNGPVQHLILNHFTGYQSDTDLF